MVCYENVLQNAIENMKMRDECLEACKYVKYGLNLNEDFPMTECCISTSALTSQQLQSSARVLLNFEKYGEEFTDYLYQSKKLYRYLGNFYKEQDFLIPKLEKMSLIHINFDESRVFTVTKDAKITTPDMIGNVGGTLGVFIGFSFLGLLDDLIELVQNVTNSNIIKKLREYFEKSSEDQILQPGTMTPIQEVLPRSASATEAASCSETQFK